jgi:hypothetical protein
MDKDRSIPNANRDCEFCGKPLHYGWCDELRKARTKAMEEGRGRPAPIMLPGQQPVANPSTTPPTIAGSEGEE